MKIKKAHFLLLACAIMPLETWSSCCGSKYNKPPARPSPMLTSTVPAVTPPSTSLPSSGLTYLLPVPVSSRLLFPGTTTSGLARTLYTLLNAGQRTYTPAQLNYVLRMGGLRTGQTGYTPAQLSSLLRSGGVNIGQRTYTSAQLTQLSSLLKNYLGKLNNTPAINFSQCWVYSPQTASFTW
jgi:hypothetical protein